MDEITIPLEARLDTTSLAVGVPRSVNTVSKFTVSREKVNISDEDVEIESLIHDETIKPIHNMIVK